jgi:PAS domain-containing protein
MDSGTAHDRGVGNDTDASLGRLAHEVDLLRRSVEQARSGQVARDVLVRDLEIAYEELRAAGEEVRVQSDTVARLVRSRESQRVLQERTLAILPVPVVLTDRHGAIRTANAAASLVLGLRVDRLLNKPLFSSFTTEDRRALRQLLAEGRDGVVGRRVATLVPRGGTALRVEVVITRQLGLGCWVLLVPGGLVDPGTGGTIEALAALATLPQQHTSPRDLADAAVRIVRGALSAEVSLVVGSPVEPAVVASTSQAAQLWDGAQIAADDGPSLLAYRAGLTVATPDVAGDTRWSGSAPRTPGSRAAAVAVPLQSGDRTVGVLTAYAIGDEPEPIATEMVEMFAVSVGGALHELELIGELDRLGGDMQRALASRAVIDQAKGIIMASRGVDAAAAWEHLLELSSAQHVKVRDLAQLIVDQARKRS